MCDLVGVEVFEPFTVVEYARRFGFAGVDLRMDHVAKVVRMEEAGKLVGAMDQAGVVAGYCSLVSGRVSVAEEVWREGMKALPELCGLARALGFDRAATVVLPGDDAREFAENEKLHVARVREAMDVMGDFGIRLGLEYVSPQTRRAGFRFPYIHDLRGALELIAKIDRKGVGLMLDSFHWHCARETGEDVLQLTNEQVVVVHLNDALAGRGLDEQVVNEREMPGESGVIDLGIFLGSLQSIGYDGPVTCEPTNAKWGKMDVEQVLERTGQAMRNWVS
jgi:sugar phosphate isomerase/epimerase